MVVLSRVDDFPWWPALVIQAPPTSTLEKTTNAATFIHEASNGHGHWARFFGTYDNTLAHMENTRTFHLSINFLTQSRHRTFVRACDEAVRYWVTSEIPDNWEMNARIYSASDDSPNYHFDDDDDDDGEDDDHDDDNNDYKINGGDLDQDLHDDDHDDDSANHHQSNGNSTDEHHSSHKRGTREKSHHHQRHHGTDKDVDVDHDAYDDVDEEDELEDPVTERRRRSYRDIDDDGEFHNARTRGSTTAADSVGKGSYHLNDKYKRRSTQDINHYTNLRSKRARKLTTTHHSKAKTKSPSPTVKRKYTKSVKSLTKKSDVDSEIVKPRPPPVVDTLDPGKVSL